MVPHRETWVASVNGKIAGILVMEGEEVDQLFLLPAMQRRGVGGLLLNHAKKLRPERLRLWTFQRNSPARRFYEKRGFVAIEFTDGSRNMEREPDVLYEWTSARA
jgi:GNAT superfamily N-acetyltransferase